MPMLNVAICGMANWGARLVDAVHRKSDKITFTAAVTGHPERHRAFADKTGIPLRTSYAEVLADPAIAAVVLATRHSQHADEIMAAASAGKHIFVEKPFALTGETALAAAKACGAAGVTLWLGFNRRHAPARIEMMRRIRAGEIGDVLHIEGNFSGPSGYNLKPEMWRANRTESPGGAMTARGVHVLDAMMEAAGLVGEVFAFSDRRKIAVDIDDTTALMMRFRGGATGYLASLHATGECWRIQVFGSKGWLEMRNDTDLIARGLEGPETKVSLPAVDKERAELEAFADAVAAGRKFLLPPEEIANGVAVLEAMVVSAARGELVRL